MLTRWISMIKRQWRQIGSSIAVLLMFFVPATRAVLARGSNSVGPGHDKNKQEKKVQNDTTSRTVTTPKGVSPIRPSTHTQTGKHHRRSKPQEK